MGSNSSCLRRQEPSPSSTKTTTNLQQPNRQTTIITSHSSPSPHQPNHEICDIRNNHQMSHSNDGHFSVLTDDLIVEVLSTLPTRALIRCKCISHKFYQLVHEEIVRRSLIKGSPSTGFFYSTHFTDSPLRIVHTPFPNSSSSSHPSLNINFLPSNNETILVGGTNGLLLCTSGRLSAGEKVLYVCDPITRDFVTIPPFYPNGQGEQILMSGTVAYDPAFDPTNFKVVLGFCPYNFVNFHMVRIMVFSSTTWEWSNTLTSYSYEAHLAVYYRGFVRFYVTGAPHILNFDVQRENKCKDIKLPSGRSLSDPSTAGVLRDRFAFASTVASQLLVWTLDNEDELKSSYLDAKWTLMYSFVDAVPFTSAPFGFHPDHNALFIVRSDDLMAFCYYLDQEKDLVQIGKIKCMCVNKIHAFTHFPQAHLALH